MSYPHLFNTVIDKTNPSYDEFPASLNGETYLGGDTATGWHTSQVRTPAEIEAERIASIKAEAHRRINARFPEWKQRNMLAESIYLEKHDPLNARVGELEDAWAWVQSVRTTSDQAEAKGTALGDIAWPA